MFPYYFSKARIICICLIFLSVGLKAQINTTSPYSRYGVGDLNSRGFSFNDALGGTGIALRSNTSLNPVNPASYSAMDSLTFTFEFGLKNKAVYRQSGDMTESKNDANISYLACAFPFSSWWYGSIGLLPISASGYNLVESDKVSVPNRDIYYSGNGGLNKFYFANTFRPFKKLSVGVNAAYLFGALDQEKTIKFTDTSTLFMNLKINNAISVSDFLFNFGLQYTDSIGKNLTYTVGAVYDNKTNLGASRNILATRFYNKGGSSIIDTTLFTEDEKNSISLPTNVGLGFSIKGSKWLVSADYLWQNWADTKVFGVDENLSNSNTVCLGAEFVPDRKSVTKYWQKVAYRFGAHYTNTYLDFAAKKEQVKDLGVSFGFGFPVKKTKSLLNVSFEIGQRGTTSNGLIKELYGIASVSFSLADIWFLKSKFD